MALHQLNWFCLLLIISLFFVKPSSTGRCNGEPKAYTAYTVMPFDYQTPGYRIWNSGDDDGYDDNIECRVKFEANHGDVVEIVIKEADLSGCNDKATFYDGSSTSDPVLATVCDSDDTLRFESSGRVILMVFKTDEYSERKKGISLSYKALDRSGLSRSYSTSTSDSTSTTSVLSPIIGIGVTCIIIVTLIVIFIRCRARRAFSSGTVVNQGQGTVVNQGQTGVGVHSQQNFDVALRNLQATQQPHGNIYNPGGAPQPSYSQPSQPPYPLPAGIQSYPPPQSGPYPPPAQGGYPYYQYPTAQTYQPPPTSSAQPLMSPYPYPSAGDSSQPLLSKPEGASGVAPSAPPPSYDDIVRGSKS